MRKLLLLSVFFSFSFSIKISAQHRSCATNEAVKQQMAIDPVYAKKVRDASKNISGYSPSLKGKPATINIPVAVHVLYNTPDQNISDAQVQSQIDVLNEDFTATNSDYNNYDAGYGAVKGNMGINYCLVKVIHKQTNHKSFNVSDRMKYSKQGGSDAIDPMHVLNIWVCDLGKSALGFAYYPGITPEKFGVVCHTNAFGRGTQYNLFAGFNLGRTISHEIGHCFGLVHIWGDSHCGNDLVDDTPVQNDPNFGCPGEGHLSTCTGTPLEMWMDYMDYSDDKCLYFFSDGQVVRANFFIDTDPQLNSIVNSSCNILPGTNKNNFITDANSINLRGNSLRNGFSLYPTITSGNLTIKLNTAATENGIISIYNQDGKLMLNKMVFVSQDRTENIDVSKLANGVYFLQLNQNTDKSTRKFIVQH